MTPIVLLIQSDPVWRCSIRRTLNARAQVEVVEAASFAEAILLIAVEHPDLIIFDIDVTERYDVTALSNLRLPRLNIPLVCLTGHAERFRQFASGRDGLVLLEKPVSLKAIESIVLETLPSRSEDPSDPPFTVLDYVQLACLGQHSVRIEATRAGRANDEEELGRIDIKDGQIWSARTRAGQSGDEAFHALALEDDLNLRCSLRPDSDEASNIEANWQALLIEAARRRDERVQSS